MMKRFGAALAALLMLLFRFPAYGEVEKSVDIQGSGITVMLNKQVEEGDKQKLGVNYPTFEGEDASLVQYLTDAITTPFLALRKLGQMAQDDVYADGSKDFIRGGYTASLDFEGILSMELSMSNRAAGQTVRETQFMYKIIDLAAKKELTVYDLFDGEAGDVDEAIRQAVYAVGQQEGKISPHIADASQVPAPNSVFLSTAVFRCIFAAGTVSQENTVIDIPWEQLALLRSAALTGGAAAPEEQGGQESESAGDGDATDTELSDNPGQNAAQQQEDQNPEPADGNRQDAVPAMAQVNEDFVMPEVATPTPMPVSGGDVNVLDLLTRGLWKQMGTDGGTYYQFTPDGKLLVVNVEDYTLEDGTLMSESLSGQVLPGGDTAFTLVSGESKTGYVLNRAGDAVAPADLVTPSPTPVPTPTPEPTATPTPEPTPEPTPTLSPYEEAKQQAPTLKALGDAASFDKMKTMPVYLTPSEKGYRESKWQVTTDESVGIYGVENGWVLVSYQIGNGTKGRMGYIEAATLKDADQVAMLSFVGIDMPLTKDANATDDPLYGKTKLTTLKKGDTVKLLAFMGEWAYVETALKDEPCRVFILQTSLMAE